jgi:Cu/Ag efflux protein CusF
VRPAAALLLALACGRTPEYNAVGDVVAVDAAASAVTIRHEDIPGLMGAMTMRFPVSAPDVLAAAVPGARVRFALAQQGTQLVVTRLVQVGAAGAGTPGVHDHTPHHGGVVAMVGMLHLEAVASPAGAVRVYLSDVWRRPLPVADVTGSVTLGLADGRRELPLVPRDDALEATGPPLTVHDVPAHVRLMRAGESIEEHFVLPLGDGRAGAAEAPLEGCVPPPRDPAVAGRLPRCTLTFHQPVTFVSGAPDGSLVLIAVVNGGVSAWAMPPGAFRLGFAAPPPITGPIDAPAHPDAVGAMAVSPDGRETALTVENRLLVHTTATGALARELPAFKGLVRDLAWSGDGSRLVVTLFYDAAAHVLAADDGRELARIPVEREGAAVASSPDRRTVAVGSEVGPIAVVDLAGERPPVVLSDTRRPITALAFAGDRLVSAASDGAVRVWRAGAIVARAATAPGLFRLALAPGGRLVAAAGLDGTIRLLDVERGEPVEAIAWHHAAVWGLAWVGPTLVSGDAQGHVALWDLTDRVHP